MIALQFSANNEYARTSARLTGALNIVCACQMQILKKEHVDLHVARVISKYILAWVVELHNKDGRRTNGVVELICQDDKAKIPVGDKVPISTGVRQKGNAIVGCDASQPLAMDHDFHYANITPSVTLFCNKPHDMSGLFFGGGKENGHGEIYVTLSDSTFESSNPFSHFAQLQKSLALRGKTPSVLVLQTDGGADHNITLYRVKLAMVAFFLSLDLDQLVCFRCAPNGSANNKVE
ncbi:hypothetical protein ACA910_003874 [Epithemia clementina (nom. ined.)]